MPSPPRSTANVHWPRADWPTEQPIQVRMGLHAGYARPVDDDYRALAVHQAARVVGAANGGQILATGR